MEQREPLYPGDANITWCSHYGEQYRDSPKTKDSTTIQSGNHTLLGIYPKKTKTLIGRDKYTPMFIAASFIVTKIWKQHKCPSTDKWVKKSWYKYTMK